MLSIQNHVTHGTKALFVDPTLEHHKFHILPCINLIYSLKDRSLYMLSCNTNKMCIGLGLGCRYNKPKFQKSNLVISKSELNKSWQDFLFYCIVAKIWSTIDVTHFIV